MSNMNRVIAVLLLACAVAAVFGLKAARQKPVPPATTATTAMDVPAERAEPLPRLVDLGAGKCIPCKMMAPILEELTQDFADSFDVEFIDVWEDPEAGEPYGIRMIPTQVFYDREGKELFRHEGFLGKEEILAKWKEHGVVASAAAPGE